MSDQPRQYRNLDLEVSGPKDGPFSVRVLGQSPGGELRADQAEQVVYRPGDFTPLVQKLEHRRITRDELMELGVRLAGLLLPGRVGERFEASVRALEKDQGLRLRLRIEPLPLAALPWEYLLVPRTDGDRQPQDFLALRPELSITRYEAFGPPLKPRARRGPFRVVMALASPYDEPKLEVEKDAEAVSAAIAELKKSAGPIDPVVLKPATRKALLDAVKECDVFHFAGHGVFEPSELAADGSDRGRGMLVLEKDDGAGDRVETDIIATALAAGDVRLAVLGACESAARDAGGAWTGVAPALVRGEIPAVVGMQFKVKDTNAALFAGYLYSRVLGGLTIDEAVAEGRLALFNAVGVEGRDWGVPVLYLRAEGGVLFPTGGDATAPGKRSGLARVVIKAEDVEGELTGARAKHVKGNLSVDLTMKNVKKGGKVTGLDVDTVGG